MKQNIKDRHNTSSVGSRTPEPVEESHSDEVLAHEAAAVVEAVLAVVAPAAEVSNADRDDIQSTNPPSEEHIITPQLITEPAGDSNGVDAEAEGTKTVTDIQGDEITSSVSHSEPSDLPSSQSDISPTTPQDEHIVPTLPITAAPEVPVTPSKPQPTLAHPTSSSARRPTPLKKTALETDDVNDAIQPQTPCKRPYADLTAGEFGNVVDGTHVNKKTNLNDGEVVFENVEDRKDSKYDDVEGGVQIAFEVEQALETAQEEEGHETKAENNLATPPTFQLIPSVEEVGEEPIEETAQEAIDTTPVHPETIVVQDVVIDPPSKEPLTTVSTNNEDDMTSSVENNETIYEDSITVVPTNPPTPTVEIPKTIPTSKDGATKSVSKTWFPTTFLWSTTQSLIRATAPTVSSLLQMSKPVLDLVSKQPKVQTALTYFTLAVLSPLILFTLFFAWPVVVAYKVYPTVAEKLNRKWKEVVNAIFEEFHKARGQGKNGGVKEPQKEAVQSVPVKVGRSDSMV
ncbi:hypothetical protein HDV05_004303 [Chytridiales sp. JEL 0842]|nr:hypothetical protein HDV05_004303 [Chytridiales sp. JEL 0842]